MMLPVQGFTKAAILALVCFFIVPLVSCRALLMKPFQPVTTWQISNSISAMTLRNHRIKPATTVIGKRFLTLEECRSTRAEQQFGSCKAARLEELTQKAIEYSNRTRILPHFHFSGDLSERSNLRYSYSDVLGREGVSPNPADTNPPGTGVTSFSTGHERSTWTYTLETRWSPTDAALAYYVTKSSANDKIKSHYQKVQDSPKTSGGS